MDTETERALTSFPFPFRHHMKFGEWLTWPVPVQLRMSCLTCGLWEVAVALYAQTQTHTFVSSTDKRDALRLALLTMNETPCDPDTSRIVNMLRETRDAR